MLTFQEIIITLERYWAEKGCLVWYPYHETVGAGTANPATVLRVLGPEPWNVGYLEPSFRPDDGRYGDNPNRMQMHHQYQVILKPIPYDPQDLYLASLYALGIDPQRNDVRFVEDNWESPALGAWGLGWEVWLNGLEISQYTYFQQAGGKALDPPALELTYGLERIAMALCGVKSVWEIPWNRSLTYGEVLHRQEVEHCVYDFEVASVDRLREMFEIFAREAEACLGRELVIPAHDYVLRCSHTFNLLDSRAAVGVTERAGYFARMRMLSRRVADAYLAQRDAAGFPMLAHLAAGSKPHLEPFPAPLAAPADLLLEIGTEELPADDLDAALAHLRATARARLEEARLSHGEVRVLGTPRRLVVHVRGLAPMQADKLETMKGPPVSIARDAGGAWTKAALGFASKFGLDPAALEVRSIGGTEYVVAEKKTEGRPAAEVLAAAIPEWIRSVPFKRTMRWLASARDGASASFAFSRPIRWIACLLADEVIPFELASVASGRTSYGLRSQGPRPLTLPSASAYFDVMRETGILVDPEERGAAVRAQAEGLAAKTGGRIDPEDLEALIGEVRQMVECPTAFLGRFDPAHLEVPSPVLVTVMEKQQRYFPVRDEAGALLPCFVGVRNGGPDHLDAVAAGNEAVLRARFADARYFFDQDRRQPLDSWLPRLDTLTFQEKLGSFLEKTKRMEGLAGDLAALTGLCASAEEREVLARAARLAKADLVTRVVTEFPYLAGVMGAEYARLQGEDPAVAAALEDQYRPFPGSAAPPRSPAGLLLALADRLDKLAGLFSLGIRPSGTADPYALRRDALGLLVALLETGTSMSIREALRLAADRLPIRAKEDDLAETAVFIDRRLSGILAERCDRPDLVAAAVAGSGDDPVRCAAALQGIAERVKHDGWDDLLMAYARCARLARAEKAAPGDLDRKGLADATEIRLADAVEEATGACRSASGVGEIFDAIQDLVDPIRTFFDTVMVMVEDERVRRSRLGLLASIDALLRGWVDLSQVEGF